MLACPLVILFSGGSLVAGFVALFLLVLGYSLLVPPLALGLLRLLQRRSVAAGAAWRALVLRGVERALPRLAPAIVALTVAVSATVGVAIMIDSFRDSVTRWLETTLRGDIYVYAEGSAERLDERWLTDLRSMPGVRQVTAGRLRTLTLGGERTRTLLLDGAAAGLRGFDLLAGPPDAARQVFDANTGILVSEPLARRRDLELGDRLLLETPDGEQSLPILGIYRDYGSSRGQALMGYGLYARHWRDRAVSTLSLQLLPGVDGDALRRRIEAYAEARQRPVAIVSAQAIRDRSLDVFDRTFAVTEVLRALVVVVAFVGIVSALLALFLERRREFAVLRAVGMTPAQLLRLLLGQAGVSGLLAGLLALPLGVLLSVVLIDVINRRSFGWSLDTQLDPLLMLQAVALATFAALLAALLPARRLAAAELRAALEMP